MTGAVEQALRDALAYAESIVDTMRDPLLVLDAGLRAVSTGRYADPTGKQHTAPSFAASWFKRLVEGGISSTRVSRCS